MLPLLVELRMKEPGDVSEKWHCDTYGKNRESLAYSHHSAALHSQRIGLSAPLVGCDAGQRADSRIVPQSVIHRRASVRRRAPTP